MDGPSARRRGRGPKIRDTVAVVSPPPVVKNVMTNFVEFFDGGGVRAARMAFAGPHAARRRGPRDPLPGGRVHRGRDGSASVENRSIPHLVVGRERHILGL